LGIATFSKYPILKKSRIPFNTSYNAAMYTDILVGTETLRVFNVHLQSIRFRQEDYAFMDTVRLKHPNQQMRGIKNIGSQLKKAFIMRAEQAEIIANYIKDSPYPVVVMGDFNDNPTDPSMRILSRGRYPEGDLYNPMEKLFRQGTGSLAYRDRWNLFDQMLFSESLIKPPAGSYGLWKARVFQPSYLKTKEGRYRGYPFRTYAGGRYQGGYSDHFPVYAFLIRQASKA